MLADTNPTDEEVKEMQEQLALFEEEMRERYIQNLENNGER